MRQAEARTGLHVAHTLHIVSSAAWDMHLELSVSATVAGISAVFLMHVFVLHVFVLHEKSALL